VLHGKLHQERLHSQRVELAEGLGSAHCAALASGRGTATKGDVSRPIRWRAAMIERPSWMRSNPAVGSYAEHVSKAPYLVSG
jgi:hypothetical protein